MERKALGRGLSSLISSSLPDESIPRVLQIAIDEIRPNPHQPRQEWDEATLADLADSIRAHGVLQPLIVRGRPGEYELVAGERRLRASRLAGLVQVPAMIRETDDEGSLRLALIENLQREDISALDAAHAYQELVEQFGMTQESVATAVGKSRSGVANTLRLLRLPSPIQESLRAREITEGHARALLAIEDPKQQQRAFLLARSGASVREIEAIGRSEPKPSQLRTILRKPDRALPHITALADELRRALGLKVEIRGDDRSGMLCIEYYSEDDLQQLADRLLGIRSLELDEAERAATDSSVE